MPDSTTSSRLQSSTILSRRKNLKSLQFRLLVAKNVVCAAAFTLFTLVIHRSATAADALRWEPGVGYRRAKLNVPATGKTGFTLMTADVTNVRWTNQISVKRYSERQNLMNGAGVALGDFDGDGFCDIYLCNKEGANALYRNLGNWKFDNVAERAGVTCSNQSSTGATFADINGDGRPDLLVNSFTGPNACFLNLGGGRFTNFTAAAGLVSKGGTTSLALGDIDGDGHLDLYVCYFGIEAILRDGGAYTVRTVNDKPAVTGRYAKKLAIIEGRIMEFGEPDILYHNDGNAHFTALDWKENFRDEHGQAMAPPWDFGLAVQIRDINGDGFPDIYVCNDFQTPDRMWLNDGHGHFHAADSLALRNMSYASMGADFADLDRDGSLDFMAVEMLSRDRARHLNQSSPMSPLPRFAGSIQNREEVARNTLCWNRGDNTYAEIAWFSGVAASDWSWTPIFLDVDLDGYEDLLITNGHMHDVNDRDVTEARAANSTGRTQDNKSKLLAYPRLDSPNAAFRNRHDLTFESMGDAWGFNSRNISHGMALADLDNDGDMDLVINCVNSPPLIYRNDSPAPRVAVRLKGRAPNTQGIGGKITLFGGPVTQTQEIICGGRYLSGDEPMRIFAAGTNTSPLRIEVAWRSGKRSVVNDVLPNYLYEVDEAGASEASIVARPVGQVAPENAESPSRSQTLFEDKSDLLSHTHLEDPFDDFARQPLLPKKLSQLGPGVAWYDLDGDGHDDLIIGNGKGGQLAIFRNNGKGGFVPWAQPSLKLPLTDDATGIVGWSRTESQRSLLIGLSRYENANTNSVAVLRFDFANGTLSEGPGLPQIPSSTGPLAIADIDSDGDLDVFVGGRMVGGRYPEPASSRIFRNENGKLTLDVENSRLLENVGLVSGAVFADLNGDGQPDLVLACEWSPIRVFENHGGKFREATRELGFDAAPGLWTSVAVGDFDGDGRLDIAAGNWGLNTFYGRGPNGPWYLYHGDFNGDGQVQMIESYFDMLLGKIVPFRDMQLVGSAMPWVRERTPTHKAYARASIAEILGDHFAKAKELKATELKTMIFLNRGAKFEPVALPAEAQWTPTMGVSVGDLDGDGMEDIVLSQNYFAVRTEDNRLDAGRGLWLKGDGKGKFNSISSHDSGLKIYGEQRGAALGDYDGDGRVDVVVTQNGAATKLYHNLGAKPGLRVRLAGPKNNPDGIGATLRLVFGKQMGPAREIHSGSGYWSQDSAVSVMGMPAPPSRIWVRWPGGKVVTGEIPKGAREISVDVQGGVKVLGMLVPDTK